MSKPVLIEAISLSELKPGITLPSPIYDARNPSVLLLGPGTRLTSQNLERLQQRGVNKIAIDSRHAAEICNPKVETPVVNTPSAPLPPPDFRKAANKPLESLLRKPDTPQYNKERQQKYANQRAKQGTQLETTLQALKSDRNINSRPLHAIAIESAEMMVDDLDLYVNCAIKPTDDDAVYQHCLRVGQLAMAMATVSGHTTSEVQQLGMGCLLSRAGLSEAAKNVASQSRTLSSSDFLEVQKNPCRTFDILQDVSDIPVGARQVAYQMFERWDGSGYPRGRSGKQIHPLARIAAVADVYVALTSARPHRAPFSSYKAVEQLLADTRKGLFDPGSIRALLQTVSLYPLGTFVQLSDGSIAVVLRTNKEHYDRPVVGLKYGEDGKPIEEKTVDLGKEEWLKVMRVMEDKELEDLDIAIELAEIRESVLAAKTAEMTGNASAAADKPENQSTAEQPEAEQKQMQFAFD